MRQFKKPSNRAAYRTPTPFNASGDDSNNERTPSPELGRAPKTNKGATRSAKAPKTSGVSRADRNKPPQFSDDEVEFVKNETSSHPKNDSNMTRDSDDEEVEFVDNKSKSSALEHGTDVELAPSPDIIEKKRLVKDRPRPIPVGRKPKADLQPQSNDNDSPGDNSGHVEDSDVDNDRTPRVSRVLFVDDDSTPVAVNKSARQSVADPDITPKASRSDEDERTVSRVASTQSNARQTRASNGISKKRVLQDAAFLSSDEDLPAHVTPKKPKKASTEAILEADSDGHGSDYEGLSGRDRIIEPLDLGIAKRDTAKSASGEVNIHSSSKGKKRARDDLEPGAPAKQLGLLEHACNNDDDVFAADLAEASRISLLEHKSYVARARTGRSSSGPLKFSDDVVEGRLHPDEIAAIDTAMRKTRDTAASEARETPAISSNSSKASKATASARDDKKSDDTRQADRQMSAVGSSAGRDTPARRTFGAMVKTPTKTPMINAGTTLLDDTMKFKVSSLPARCDVTRSHLQDTLLADDYLMLPMLRLGALRPWNTPPGSGSTMVSVWFSGWAVQCPNLDFDAACASLRMVRYKNFINPSRISPLEVNILFTSNDCKRSMLQCGFKTAVCLSPILTHTSFLLEPINTGLRNKLITGHFHHQEWERFESFTCMVFDKKVMIAQIRDGAMAFSTMGNARGDRDLSSPVRPPRNPSILSSASSKAQTLKNKIVRPDTNIRSVLDFTDDIPVYDARGVPFNFASDLDDMETSLPRWLDEVPSHSFAVVGYTMGQYEKENRSNLTTNVLFVILLATEGSDD